MERGQRRLAAILAADVAGYSRLMAADEAGTVVRLRTLRAEIIEPKIAEFCGRVVGSAGDSLLVEFASAVNAVQCAVETQQRLAGLNASLPEDRRMAFRIGVNLGDIIAEDGTIHGDGVNVAARLEKLADPGGVCIGANVHDQVRSKLPYDYTDLGPQRAHNIPEPVHAWRIGPAVRRAAAAVKGPGRDASPPAGKPSIAVLPFENMSGDAEQDYFSDGITEDLITELSRFRELLVISHTSSFAFKGRKFHISDVSRSLGAQYVVAGSIRRAGKRVRITAQLTDTASDKQIWAERYDRDLEDIFQAQDDVVRHVVATLVGRLEHERYESTRRVSADRLAAYDLFLRGRQHFFTWTLEDNQKAREYFEAAVRIDPDYAAAYAALSEASYRSWLNGWSNSPEDDRAAFLAIARKAVELDDQDSRTQMAFGIGYMYHGELAKARHHLEIARRLNPNHTRVLAFLSRLVLFEGDPARSVEYVREAIALNPFGKYEWFLGQAQFTARDYRNAIATLTSIRDPTEVVVALLAACRAMMGEEAEAGRLCSEFLRRTSAAPGLKTLTGPLDWQRYVSERWPFQNRNDLTHLVDALRKAGLPI